MPRTRTLNLVGETYGRLLVLEEVEPHVQPNGKKVRKYKCLCECGNETIVRQNHLRRGCTVSCGCYKKEQIVKSNKATKPIHGESNYNLTKEFNTWQSIKTRCFNSNYKYYKNYGGRGITVCDRWLESYSNFLEDVGRAPSPHYSIDRIDNDGNYEPDNCRWATSAEQSRNQRTTKLNEDLVRYIRQQRQLGTKLKVLAEELGIDIANVSAVANYKTWKEVI